MSSQIVVSQSAVSRGQLVSSLHHNGDKSRETYLN